MYNRACNCTFQCTTTQLQAAGMVAAVVVDRATGGLKGWLTAVLGGRHTSHVTRRRADRYHSFVTAIGVKTTLATKRCDDVRLGHCSKQKTWHCDRETHDTETLDKTQPTAEKAEEKINIDNIYQDMKKSRSQHNMHLIETSGEDKTTWLTRLRENNYLYKYHLSVQGRLL